MNARVPGATLRGGHCEFRVWAPLAREVLVELDGDPRQRARLVRSDDGYHDVELGGITAGQRYRYVVDGAVLPDPCSRFQPEGPHGPSQIVDPDSYAWKDHEWTGIDLRGLVVYELHIGTFTAAGTFAAAATRLTHLRNLGVTAVELMPVAECPGRFNWGYDGVAWFAPCRNYGPYDALKAFVDAAHAQGIGVIQDVVYNHFGPDGNYLQAFSPYYVNAKATEWGEAINFDGPHSGPVRDLVMANACYWIREFHLDGLRLDATQSISDASDLHIVAQVASAVRAAAGKRRILVIAENEPQCATHLLPASAGGYGLDAMWNDDFHHSAMVAATGRRHAYYHDYLGSAQEFVSSARRGFLYQGQYYPWQQKRRGAPLATAVATCVAFLQNHDQVANSLTGVRLHQQCSPGICRTLTAVLLLGPQTPLLFMGQEFQASSPFLFFADHQGALGADVFAGRRQFLLQFPGTGTVEGREFLDDPADETTFLRSKLNWAECTEENPALVLHRDLIALRRGDPVIAGQGCAGLDGAVLSDHAFVLRWFDDREGDRLLVVNLATDIAQCPVPEPLLAPPRGRFWALAFSTEQVRYGGSGAVEPDGATGWEIPGQCAMLLKAQRR